MGMNNLGKIVGSVIFGMGLLGCEADKNANFYRHNENPVLVRECTSPQTMECGFQRRWDEELSKHEVKEITGVIIKQQDVYPRRSGLDRFVFGDPLPAYTEAWLRKEDSGTVYLRLKRGRVAGYNSTGEELTVRYRMDRELVNLDVSNFVKNR